MPTEPTEQVDHKAEALRLLEIAGSDWRAGDGPHNREMALVHSNLAIAEELKSVGDLLYRDIEERASRVH